MNRFFSSFLATSYLSAGLLAAWNLKPATAQSDFGLYYTFFGQKIQLVEQSNAIAVNFKPTRGRGKPLYLQLQQDLTSNHSENQGRGAQTDSNDSGIEVQPIGDDYAIVKLPSQDLKAKLTQQIQQQDYIAATVPILSRRATKTSSSENILLPNEILVSFAPELSSDQINAIVHQQNLEIVRKLRFTKNRYIVKSLSDRGTAVLNITNHLPQVAGIQSATPNFIQSLSSDTVQQSIPSVSPSQSLLSRLPKLTGLPFTSNLLSLEWHLNSTPNRGTSLPRTDVQATDAWKKSHGGERVVVAVIDSAIQWDHPDLKNNLYTLPPNTPDALPNETHGWDFVNNSPDTRISFKELAQIQPLFRNSFELDTPTLLKRYASSTAKIYEQHPDWTPDKIASTLRNRIQSYVAEQFHGTWTSGVIAAHPSGEEGVIGVAPKATLLPIRGMGLDLRISPETEIETTGYAAARNADVISMSFGGALPSQDVANQIFSILDRNPKTVMIASAGNESVSSVAFPAMVPGVISVGATNLDGQRSPYSNYGQRLDLVAPGGDTSKIDSGGILTTGGTWIPAFWQGISKPSTTWGFGTPFDPQGKYVEVQGTSFSAPVVSGVVALMKSEDPDRRLTRAQITNILKKTASYQGLQITKSDEYLYRLEVDAGLKNPSTQSNSLAASPQQYFFGSGLVNAAAAVEAVKHQ